jgi:hypothetical protein
MRTIPLFALALLALLPGAAAGAAESKTEAVKFQEVTVKPGDTLWSISQHYLKDPQQWSEILRYNKLPNSDPTVALPGMTLRMPVALIKEELRAAVLVQKLNKVLARRKENPDWRNAELNMALFRDDGLQTLAGSRAQVRFINGELLNLDQNSMAILKPRKLEGADLELQKGQILTGRSRVVTRSANIMPQTPDTKYTASVLEDMTTRVAVVKGATVVEGSGRKVTVNAGFQTDVPPFQAPQAPTAIPDLPQFLARVNGMAVVEGPALNAPTAVVAVRPQRPDGSDFGKMLRDIPHLAPISAYHIQAAAAPDFAKVLYDHYYDMDERVDLRDMGLTPGAYWVRVATVDLLGAEGKFAPARQFQVAGRGGKAP